MRISIDSGISTRLDGAVMDVGDPGRQLIRRPEGEMDAVCDRPGEAEHPPLEAREEDGHIARWRMLEPEPANGGGPPSRSIRSPLPMARKISTYSRIVCSGASKSRSFQSSTMR